MTISTHRGGVWHPDQRKEEHAQEAGHRVSRPCVAGRRRGRHESVAVWARGRDRLSVEHVFVGCVELDETHHTDASVNRALKRESHVRGMKSFGIQLVLKLESFRENIEKL
jgi:hypothetical protein